jgi:histidinol dehydrogenase
MKILRAGQAGFSQFCRKNLLRGTVGFARVEKPVRSILGQIQKRGDAALFELTRKFDGWNPSPKTLQVKRAEILSAYRGFDREYKKALKVAAARIEKFHSLQKQASWSFAETDGNILGQIVQPMDRVGLYVPGGKAAYPSSLLMNVIPARVAGVREIIVACPAPRGFLNPAILAAAHIGGIETIFKMGGAQAIAAMAYGTQTIPRVDKIVGPGNLYVAMAKRMVFGEVSIDSIAGPSEIVVISDGSGPPAWIAADLISQAEHDEEAAAILLCTSQSFGEEVQREIRKQLIALPRRKIAEQALRRYGAIIRVENLAAAAAIANDFAPEHLELAVSDPFRLLQKIKNAGAIFLGHISPEAIGDYVAGPNHVLPTAGTARFSSPLGVYDFIKRSSLICLSPEGLKRLSAPAMRMAQMENLEGHRESVRKRQKW